jgi:tryptophanyl-tRNA synthetase
LKAFVTDALNSHLGPIRARRSEIENDPGRVRDILKRGIQKARQEAERTLAEVRTVMNMDI